MAEPLAACVRLEASWRRPLPMERAKLFDDMPRGVLGLVLSVGWLVVGWS